MSKILFGGVHLLDEVDRLGGVGFAYANTSYFRSAPPANYVGTKPQGYSIELDTATGLVTITAEAGGAVVVPIGRVKRFEPLLVDAAAMTDAPEKRGPGRPRKDAES